MQSIISFDNDDKQISKKKYVAHHIQETFIIKSKKLKKTAKLSMYRRKLKIIANILLKEYILKNFNSNISRIEEFGKKAENDRNKMAHCMHREDKYDYNRNIQIYKFYIQFERKWFEALLDPIYFKNIKREDKKDFSLEISNIEAFKILIHECYHTVNMIENNPIEEAITELNAHIHLRKHIKDFYGVDWDFENKPIYHTYNRYIQNILAFFEKVGIKNKEALDIIVDIKNFDLNNNLKKYQDYKRVDGFTEFLEFIDVWYKPGVFKRYYPEAYKVFKKWDESYSFCATNEDLDTIEEIKELSQLSEDRISKTKFRLNENNNIELNRLIINYREFTGL